MDKKTYTEPIVLCLHLENKQYESVNGCFALKMDLLRSKSPSRSRRRGPICLSHRTAEESAEHKLRLLASHKRKQRCGSREPGCIFHASLVGREREIGGAVIPKKGEGECWEAGYQVRVAEKTGSREVELASRRWPIRRWR